MIKLENKYTLPVLDGDFIPFEGFIREYLSGASVPVKISFKRLEGQVTVFETKIHRDNDELNLLYLERLIKFLLWARGGYEIKISGADHLAARLARIYAPSGERAFDYDFMSLVYDNKMTITASDSLPTANELSKALGGNLNGCRIGFDAGGTDRKVSAVVDGENVFSEEVIWFPKEQSDPDYHYNEIVKAFKTAASHMPRVDAIGISSAGVYVDNKTKVASLFIKVSPSDMKAKVEDIYLRAAKEIGDVPVEVVNDGDVAALAGALSKDCGSILGIAMGTSEAAGFVDDNKRIMGWLNELAFAPIDLGKSRANDEWSGDDGCGVKYLSQDAVLRLAPKVGIDLSGFSGKADMLKAVQTLAEDGHGGARDIFATIGAYLGHSVALYHRFYGMRELLLMGRVSSGVGGEIIIKQANEVIANDYPELGFINIQLPDEQSRRVGQSIAAASLPRV